MHSPCGSTSASRIAGISEQRISLTTYGYLGIRDGIIIHLCKLGGWRFALNNSCLSEASTGGRARPWDADRGLGRMQTHLYRRASVSDSVGIFVMYCISRWSVVCRIKLQTETGLRQD